MMTNTTAPDKAIPESSRGQCTEEGADPGADRQRPAERACAPDEGRDGEHALTLTTTVWDWHPHLRQYAAPDVHGVTRRAALVGVILVYGLDLFAKKHRGEEYNSVVSDGFQAAGALYAIVA